jgi:probable aminopeptidase NPEPL1
MAAAYIDVFSTRDYPSQYSLEFSQVCIAFGDKISMQNALKRENSTLMSVLKLSDEGDIVKLAQIGDKLSSSGDFASSLETFVYRGGEKVLAKVVLILLPAACSRHNAPSRCHALGAAMKGRKTPEGTIVYLVPSAADHAYSQICAVGRQYPLLSLKSSEASSGHSKVHIVVEFPAGTSEADEKQTVSHASVTIDQIRLAQQLADSPPNIMHSDAMVDVALALAAELEGVSVHTIRGAELEEYGLRGIWSVGKASEHLPALVALTYRPPGVSREQIGGLCLVGKGIVYDTGGLSIKTPTTSMAGMKMDMHGAASVLGAFLAAVKGGVVTNKPLHAVLCIAENSVGPLSTRPDDVIVFLSGKSVEINNTDAEGRLVLADGCYWAHKTFAPSVIADIATLTGAQLIATGKNHAAIYCSDEGLEQQAIAAGKLSGDLIFPVPYCPEFYRNEFRSTIADMKNSVADRGNAQVSCAGQFIGNHLEEFLAEGGKWLHTDAAGPCLGDRATGYGVALLFSLAKTLCGSS